MSGQHTMGIIGASMYLSNLGRIESAEKHNRRAKRALAILVISFVPCHFTVQALTRLFMQIDFCREDVKALFLRSPSRPLVRSASISHRGAKYVALNRYPEFRQVKNVTCGLVRDLCNKYTNHLPLIVYVWYKPSCMCV